MQVRARKQYDVEKVLKYRGSGARRQALVKWKGYGDKFNTWEPAKKKKKMAFTMTLPSNSSMHVFPNNTLTTYDTLLAEYVTSPTQLECALQEITCPTSWYNVKSEPLVVIQGVQDKQQTVHRMSIKRLLHVLKRRSHKFFPTQESQEPIFSRHHTSPYDTTAKDYLE